MNYFTENAWIITFEKKFGYDRSYGIVKIFNKESAAKRYLGTLKSDLNSVEYELKKVPLNEETELFKFNE